MPSLSEELEWRGFINQTTFSNLKDLDGQPLTFYFGVDPSADSMTLGHLAPAMMVRHFINAGHKAILLVGGATGLIGDPDGKKQERDIKTEAEVEQYAQQIAKQYSQIFNGQSFEVVNNIDWFKDMGYLKFLREVGKIASMTQMLDREFIKERIGEGGSGISYAEFSYSLIQGYDFLHLYRTKGATLQLSGADQWGNGLTGVELIRKLEQAEAHVLTTPLIINKQTGVKFGKSEAGAVWLSPDKTSPYQFYQFWLNCDDQFSEDLIKIYTILPRNEIEALITEHKNNPGARLLQKALARQVTITVHGEQRLKSVELVNDVLFGSHDISELNGDDLKDLSAEIPTVSKNISLIDALVNTGIATSNGDARRLIEGNSVSINGIKVPQDIRISETSLVKKGKNSFILVN